MRYSRIIINKRVCTLPLTARLSRPPCNNQLTTQTRIHPYSQSTLSATQKKPSRWRHPLKRFLGPPPPLRARNPLNYMELERNRRMNNRYRLRRMFLASIGLIFSLAGLIIMKRRLKEQLKGADNSLKMDAPSGVRPDALKDGNVVVVSTKPGQPEIKLDVEGNELVETGTSTIPHFPRTILLPKTGSDSLPGAVGGSNEEYSLLGLGIRTVSFLSIQVYVLGLYVRTTDLAKLQSVFVKHINPIGSSLIPGEKDQLRRELIEGDSSADLWEKVLQEAGVSSAIRIVPTRNTDFGHLRDGWIRGITARTQEATKRGFGANYEDEVFGESVKAFKALFGGKGKAPKGSELLLMRDEKGRLDIAYGESENKPSDGEMKGKRQMGSIEDERISRLVWLGYLGGKNVSSEVARKNIVDGVMELVERPVGTVGIQIS